MQSERELEAARRHNARPPRAPSYNPMKMEIDDDEAPEPIRPLQRQVVGNAANARANVKQYGRANSYD